MLAIILLLCLGCALQPKMIEINRSYDQREMTVGVGEVLELSLPENPTTGFRWDFTVKPEPAFTIVRDEFEPMMSSPGKGGTHHWQFKAVLSGSGAIKLEYRRPWEKDAPAAQTFGLTVRVR